MKENNNDIGEKNPGGKHRLSDISAIEKLTETNRDPTIIQFDEAELSPDTENCRKVLGQELLTTIESYSLLDYEIEHLATRRKGLFSQMAPEEIMTFQKSVISKPLIYLPSAFNDMAIQLFKNLMKYMGDKKTLQKPNVLILKHTKLAMSSPEELKDEGYLQVIKQITDNPNEESREKGWIFFSIMASIYPPSMELYYCLIKYLLEIVDGGDENLKKKANYIAIRLMKTFESKRKFSPTEQEILFIRQMKQIPVEIHFFSGGATTMQIESYTTIRDLKSAVMKKLHLNINRIPYYAIYDICYKPDCIEERYLSSNNKVCDILAVWEKEKEEFQKKKIDLVFKFFLKIQIYYNYNKDDVDTVTMRYVQNSFEVLKGFFPLKPEEIVKLAAIKFYIDYGQISTDDLLRHVSTEIRRYIPCNTISQIKTGVISVEKILKAYSSYNFNSKMEAKNEYLDILKNNDLWETTQFVCKYSSKYNTENTNSEKKENPDHITETCVVCISPREVIVTDEQRNLIVRLKYKDIASWGVNGDLFVIVKKKEKNYNKMYFESSQSQLFKILIDSYSSILAGKNMVDILLQTDETCKMFESLPVSKAKNGESIRCRQSTVYSIDEV